MSTMNPLDYIGSVYDGGPTIEQANELMIESVGEQLSTLRTFLKENLVGATIYSITVSAANRRPPKATAVLSVPSTFHRVIVSVG